MTAASPDTATEPLWDALRTVLDPEVGMNIVDLGLVYRLEISGATVAVDITMTSPACPMGEEILEEVTAVLNRQLPPDYVLALNLVWEPPWSPALMSESARARFGWDE